MKQKTQLEMVREHLQAHKSITSWEAIQTYHITRLAHYILCLRKDGLTIQSEQVKSNGKWWVKYNLC
jgi:hypothetical protein